MEQSLVLSHLEQMQNYFASGATRNYEWRKQQLQKLKGGLYKYEEEIYKALYKDLKKNKEECWITEIGFTIAEINNAIKTYAIGWHQIT